MNWELHTSKNRAWSAATKSLGLLLLVASFMFLSTSARAEEPSATVNDTTATVDDTIDDTTATVTSQLKQPIEDEQTADLALTGHRRDDDVTRSLIDIAVSPSEPFNETSLTTMWTNLQSAAISLGSASGPGADIGLVAILIQLPPVVPDLKRRLRLAASQGPIADHALTIDIPG